MDPIDADATLEIDEIHAIVYGGREFHRRNAIAAPLYTVFGVGGSTYKTAAYPHRSPDWNESGNFQVVSALVPFRFQVFQQHHENQPDELIGAAVIPLDKLPNKEESKECVIRLKHPTNREYAKYSVAQFLVCTNAPKKIEAVFGTIRLLKNRQNCLETCLVISLVTRKNIQCDATITVHAYAYFACYGKCDIQWGGIPSRAYLLYECYVVKRRAKDTRPVIGWFNRTLPKVVDCIVYTEIRKTIKSTFLVSCRRSAVRRDSSEAAASVNPSPFLIRKLMESHGSMPIFPQMSQLAVVKIQSAAIGTTSQTKSSNDAQTQTNNVYLPSAVVISGPISLLERSAELTQKELFLDSRHECNKKSLFKHTFPLINDILPEEGPVWGGTRIAITGKDLGTCAADIIGLTVCGSDCLSSLEYETDRLIHCTTKAWRACIGTVVLITHSGGRSRSEDTARFSFLAHCKPSDEASFPDIVSTVALDDEPNLDNEIVVPDKWTAFLRTVDEGTQTATTTDNEIKQLARLLEENNMLKLALDETKRELDELRRRSKKGEADDERKNSTVSNI